MYTLIRQEGTFWTVDPKSVKNGRADMLMRGSGSLAIGLKEGDDPKAKLHVRGGNVKIRSGADGTGAQTGNGRLETTGDLSVERDVKTKIIQTDKAGANEGFFYSDTVFK